MGIVHSGNGATKRVPVMYMWNPQAKLWLTNERGVSPTGQPVLIDATSHVYGPADVPGVLFVKAGTCDYAFYDAAYTTGYQVMWMQ